MDLHLDGWTKENTRVVTLSFGRDVAFYVVYYTLQTTYRLTD